ncbi:hypothetical protein SPRG_00798 [Saprolegnia parasitica CBS 223.65]|uniref:Queuosine 5'-phosphate N-glycosylase/hydrolase n=1 Tax=Saprolegnia parasitica (strain CBS 223.65) TaxID=695850 RepID=A0A067D7X8_SAPPC|nr:hypothetical protein SPRG_00798 [Saprolegnia parasitica CBS 223.65]KDO34736.1 hypothetical protein SPRG_00798 [Saprolegnia parasitica CBS 223.65]|eukprot:XP_012194405.1 hypothetical protein SPRG_00798 [Saprolegnia parasitica CBS 223.65]
MDPTAYVRESTARVVAEAEHVKISPAGIAALTEKLEAVYLGQKDAIHDQIAWDFGDVHYFEDAANDGPLTCQYVFVLDALNFCFWPTPDMEYEHLARGLKQALTADATIFDADRLATVDATTVASWFAPFSPPQLDERVRKVRELGAGLARFFDGKAINLIRQAQYSAVEVLRLVLAHFPGFQDHAVYKGNQVFLYKRVQILVGDVWAAYGRRVVVPNDPSTHSICGFYDIDRLTMFADYRVPQVLRPEGVLEYTPALEAMIQAKQQIPFGSHMEIEIRACTIQAVEMLHAALVGKGHRIKVIELDWLLWQIGENAKEALPFHHRTLSVFY